MRNKMQWGENPWLDEERYRDALDVLLEMRPKCDCCGNHIQEDSALHYRTPTIDIWLCDDCVEDNTEYIEVE